MATIEVGRTPLREAINPLEEARQRITSHHREDFDMATSEDFDMAMDTGAAGCWIAFRWAGPVVPTTS